MDELKALIEVKIRKATLYCIRAYDPTAELRRHTEGCIYRRTAVASDIRLSP